MGITKCYATLFLLYCVFSVSLCQSTDQRIYLD